MEIWKPIAGYDGQYEVSTTGKVRTNNYMGKGKQKDTHTDMQIGGDDQMTIIKPQPRQEEFLKNPADIVIY